MEAVLLKKWESLASRYDELTDTAHGPVRDESAGPVAQVDKERTEIEAGRALISSVSRTCVKQLEEAAQMLGGSLGRGRIAFIGDRRERALEAAAARSKWRRSRVT